MSVAIAVTHHSLSAQKLGVDEWIIDTYFFIPSPQPYEPESCAKVKVGACFRDSFVDGLTRGVADKKPFAQKLGIEDPVGRLQDPVFSSGIKTADGSDFDLHLVSQDVKYPLSTKGFQYLLHFETQSWGIKPSPGYYQFKWTKHPYAVHYSSRAQLIDVRGSRIIAEDSCKLETPFSSSLEKLTANEGELLRGELFKLADECADHLSTNLRNAIVKVLSRGG